MKLRVYISPNALPEVERAMAHPGDEQAQGWPADAGIVSGDLEGATVVLLDSYEPVGRAIGGVIGIRDTGGVMLYRDPRRGTFRVGLLYPDPLIHRCCCPCGADFVASQDWVPKQCGHQVHPEFRCGAFQVIVPGDEPEFLRALELLVRLARSEEDSEDEEVLSGGAAGPVEYGWQIAPYPVHGPVLWYIVSLWREGFVGARTFRHSVRLTAAGAIQLVAKLGIPRHENGRYFPVQTSTLYIALARREWKGTFPKPQVREGWYIDSFPGDEEAELP